MSRATRASRTVCIHPSLIPQRFDMQVARIQGCVPCGKPFTPFEDIDEGDSVGSFLSDHPGASFYFYVQGDSMTGVGLHSGDMITVDTKVHPRIGDIVLAQVNNEITCKIFDMDVRTHRQSIVLRPANERYEPIIVGECEDFLVIGVVVSISKRLR